MKYLLPVLALLLVGCTKDEANYRIDHVTRGTVKAVEGAGEAAKKAADVTLDATGSSAAGVKSAIEGVKESTAGAIDSAKELTSDVVEKVGGEE